MLSLNKKQTRLKGKNYITKIKTDKMKNFI